MDLEGLPQSELEAIKKRAHSVCIRGQVCSPSMTQEEADIANLLRHVDWLTALPAALRDAKKVRERGERLMLCARLRKYLPYLGLYASDVRAAINELEKTPSSATGDDRG
jgi:hypothetical protein